MSTKKNFIYNIFYQILSILLPLITTPYIARVIGPEGVGQQSYTYSIANYFVLFAMLGVNNHGNRSIAMVRDDKEKLSKKFMNIFLLKAITSIIMIIFYTIYICYVAKEYKLLLLIQALYIISALLDINWFFFGLEKFKLTVIRNTIIRLLSVLAIFIFVKDSNDLYGYSLILAISGIVSQLILWRYLKEYISFVKVELKNIFKELKPTLILFIPVLAISIYQIMDKIMLGSMSGVIQVGFYENSEKIMRIPLSVIIALGTVMLPKVCNLKSKGENSQIKKYIRVSLDYAMFMAIGSMFGLIGMSGVLIPIFLGDEFKECIPIVAILAITILFVSWANVIRTQYLIPNKKDKVYIVSTVLGAIVNFIINFVLIPRYGAMGAAIGTIFAEATVAIYQTIKIREELEITNYLKRVAFYMIPGIIMCIVLKYLGSILGVSFISSIILVSIGGLIYGIIGIGYMIKIKNEIVINLLQKIVK